MIIISQDRCEIVNFNMVTNMFTLNDGNIRCMLSSGDDTFIAKYKTEERAKEVLQEIVALLENEEMLHIRKSTLNTLDELEEPKYILKPVSAPKVYEMPLE